MKKILCLILSAVMIFSSVGVGMTASALQSYDWRPEGVYEVIAPIIYGKSTSFAESINEIGYKSVNDIADGNPLTGYTSKPYITEDEFDGFIAANSNDEMFGVSYNFLYNKETNAFMWTFLDYDLKRILTDEVINEIIVGVVGSNQVKVGDNFETVDASTFKATIGKADFTIHDIEMYAAAKAQKRTVCTCKTKYDTCTELLAGYEYDYPEKSSDKEFYNDIVETKKSVYNPWTNKNEVHYDYAYKFEKGVFGLMRANSNNQLAKAVQNIWGDGGLFKTPQIATANAKKIANFIGNLINPNFSDLVIKSGENIFKDEKRITKEIFFEKVTVLSGLDLVLQAKWCNAKAFDVKKVMAAFGVNVKDDVIYDSELTQGKKMGRRILTDIYTEFCLDPMGYVMNLFQLFCKNYTSLYRLAFEELLSVKFLSVMTESRSGDYPELKWYSGTELDTVEGFLGFIVDCAYMEKAESSVKEIRILRDKVAKINETLENRDSSLTVDKINELIAEKSSALSHIAMLEDQVAQTNKFTFAPMPMKRFTTAADTNELFVYLLCYFELNRIYNGNLTFIADFIKGFVNTVDSLYESGKTTEEERKTDKDLLVSSLAVILPSFLMGDLTFAGETGVFTFHTGILTAGTISEVLDGGFLSNIQKALAKFFQNFIDAMDNLMNLLFGWTEGLFKDKEATV